MSTPNTHWPTVVDLFSGCGGVTEALKKRRFRVVAAVDNDPVACRTYRKNHPTVHLFESDIADVSPAAIRSDLLDNQDLDLLIVCAPCQPFSSQGRKDKRDKRASLILSAIRFAEALKPALILFENVPGLATPRFNGILDAVKQMIQYWLSLLGLSLELIGFSILAWHLIKASRLSTAWENFKAASSDFQNAMFARFVRDSDDIASLLEITAGVIRDKNNDLDKAQDGLQDLESKVRETASAVSASMDDLARHRRESAPEWRKNLDALRVATATQTAAVEGAFRRLLTIARYGIFVVVIGAALQIAGAKLSVNAERDRKNEAALQAAGWDLFIIWECALDEGISEVISFLGKRRSQMAAIEAT